MIQLKKPTFAKEYEGYFYFYNTSFPIKIKALSSTDLIQKC